MNRRFVNILQRYLAQSKRSASELERTADMGAGWYSKIRDGMKITTDKVEQLLSVVPDDVGRELLRAFLLDSAPTDWQPRVSVSITEPAVLKDSEHNAFDPGAPEAFDQALAILQRHGTDPRVRRIIFSLIELTDLR